MWKNKIEFLFSLYFENIQVQKGSLSSLTSILKKNLTQKVYVRAAIVRYTAIPKLHLVFFQRRLIHKDRYSTSHSLRSSACESPTRMNDKQ